MTWRGINPIPPGPMPWLLYVMQRHRDGDLPPHPLEEDGTAAEGAAAAEGAVGGDDEEDVIVDDAGAMDDLMTGGAPQPALPLSFGLVRIRPSDWLALYNRMCIVRWYNTTALCT